MEERSFYLFLLITSCFLMLLASPYLLIGLNLIGNEMGGALIMLFLLPLLAFLIVGAITIIMAIFGMIRGPGRLRKRIVLWFGLIACPLLVFAVADFSGLPETPVGNAVMAILGVIGLGAALFFSLGWFFRWAVSDVFAE